MNENIQFIVGITKIISFYSKAGTDELKFGLNNIDLPSSNAKTY